MRFGRCASAVVSLFALAGAPAWAQGPRAGIEVGINASYLTVFPGTTRSMGAGFMAGAFAIAPITSTINIQPEIQYSQRHSQLTLGAGTAAATTYDVKLDYFSIPILVRMMLFKGMYVTEGPAIHFPIRAKRSDEDIKDNTKTDVSLVIGVGVKAGKLMLEGRWDSGIRQIQKQLHGLETSSRNRAISGLLVIPLK